MVFDDAKVLKNLFEPTRSHTWIGST